MKFGYKFLFFFLSMAVFTIVSWLAARYFPVEPDVANSPIVWKEISDNGFSFIKYWKPTSDNWYFTVYPLNFLFFYLSGSYDLGVLKTSTSVYSIGIPFLAYGIVRVCIDKYKALLALPLLAFISSFSYIFAFVGHPFSHNSTNFFGLLCFLLYVINLKKSSTICSLAISIVATLAAISDPWFIASFFIPIVVCQVFFVVISNNGKKDTAIYTLFLIIAWSGVVQKILGIPVHHFKIVSLKTMIDNIEWLPFLIGKPLNIFVVDSDFSSFLSFFIWIGMFLCAFYCAFKENKKQVLLYFIVLSFFSIVGVISSFVMSYESASIISARFFVNVTCVVLIVCCLGVVTRIKKLFFLVMMLFVITSISSYIKNTQPLHNQKTQVENYISFLEMNNLYYGYGSFWGMSNTVNWLSNGNIHVTPIFFNNNGTLDFASVRVQTMKSWHTAEYFENAPARQFIAINVAKDGERCTNINVCLSSIHGQLGKPDEVLYFQGDTILVYNKRLGI